MPASSPGPPTWGRYDPPAARCWSGKITTAPSISFPRSNQPYVQEQLKLAITGGAVNLHGHAKYASPEPSAPLVNFTGDLAVTNFDTTDDVLFKDFAKWDSLTVDGIHLDMQPDKLQVDQVKFIGLNTSL